MPRFFLPFPPERTERPKAHCATRRPSPPPIWACTSTRLIVAVVVAVVCPIPRLLGVLPRRRHVLRLEERALPLLPLCRKLLLLLLLRRMGLLPTRLCCGMP